jgi:hypothetical protein
MSGMKEEPDIVVDKTTLNLNANMMVIPGIHLLRLTVRIGMMDELPHQKYLFPSRLPILN